MNTRPTAAAIVSAALAITQSVAASAAANTGVHAMPAESVQVADYEAQVRSVKPANGLAPATRNDVRRFVYEWFSRFEHAAPMDYYLEHLDDKNMSLTFPGMKPFTSHAEFAKWYANLLAQTLWNFHEIAALQVKRTAPDRFLVSFVVDWFGEVKADSPQRASWQSRKDSNLYHYHVRQTWEVKAGEQIEIESLVAGSGDTPSPISE